MADSFGVSSRSTSKRLVLTYSLDAGAPGAAALTIDRATLLASAAWPAGPLKAKLAAAADGFAEAMISGCLRVLADQPRMTGSDMLCHPVNLYSWAITAATGLITLSVLRDAAVTIQGGLTIEWIESEDR